MSTREVELAEQVANRLWLEGHIKGLSMQASEVREVYRIILAAMSDAYEAGRHLKKDLTTSSELGTKTAEDRALDALLVSILRRDKLPQLTEEEKAAMNNLGADFINRILAGDRRAK